MQKLLQDYLASFPLCHLSGAKLSTYFVHHYLQTPLFIYSMNLVKQNTVVIFHAAIVEALTGLSLLIAQWIDFF